MTRFAAGARVRARAADPDAHTRLPRYIRGHVGEVLAIRATWPLPVAGVLPGPGDHPGSVDRRGGGEHLLQDPVEFRVGGQPGGDHALLEPARPGRYGKLVVLAAHGASSR